ncbi:MAG: LysR family transcriptional regulator [Mesorhizobium sp.]|nr:MAG: LysR family transcriptional regulator [Mesorhizobium sp.]TIO81259.1 MAG: LysR family transcriptional regulator [Mesorhizobium sp.]
MNLPVLDLDVVKAFVAVADHRSFTRAAASLNRTQSAVSMQIKRLEDRLGVELFHRSNVNVDLSPAGEGLLGYARRLLVLNDEAVGSLREHKLEGEAAEVRIAESCQQPDQRRGGKAGGLRHAGGRHEGGIGPSAAQEIAERRMLGDESWFASQRRDQRRRRRPSRPHWHRPTGNRFGREQLDIRHRRRLCARYARLMATLRSNVTDLRMPSIGDSIMSSCSMESTSS